MSTAPPLACRWDGECFAPLPRLAKLADERFVIGEVYHLVEHQERSSKSHRHYFAMVREAWENLPEDETRFPTPEHLRKWALCKSGYADQEQIVCASKAEAIRWWPILVKADTYAVVIPKGPIITVYRAKSQSVKAMGAKDFQQSKDDVLRIVANMIDVAVAQLDERARQAA